MKPTMRVVEMRHRSYFICGSKVTSVKSVQSNSGIFFDDSEVDYDGEIR